MHCLGCGYNLNQLTTPRCPECGRGFDARDAKTWGTVKAYRHLKIRNRVGWLVMLLVVAVTGVCFYRVAAGGDPFLAMFWVWLFAFSPLAILASIWLGMSITLPGRPRLLGVFAGLGLLILNLSFLTSWPLDVGFKLSEDDLTRLAQRVEAGQPPAVPVRAGVYEVVKIELRDGHATLWISGGSGPDGFVHGMTDAEVERNYWLWSFHRINRDWHIVHED